MTRRAFTLIEFLVLLAIIGIIAAVFTSARSNPIENRAMAAARKLQSDIRYAQSYAVASQKRTRVSFNTAADTYSVYYEATPIAMAWTLMRDPLTRKDFTVNLREGEYAGVGIVAASFRGCTNLVFDASGTPYGYTGSSGYSSLLPLLGSGIVTLPNNIWVGVEPNTGNVTITTGELISHPTQP